MSDLHFIYRDDKVYAIRSGKVVASAESLAALEKLAYGDPGYGEADPYANGGDQDTAGMFHDQSPFAGEQQQGYQEVPCPQCGRGEGAFEPGQPCMACGYQDAGHGGGMQGAHPDHMDDGGGAYGDPGDDYPEHYPQSSTRPTHIVTPGGLKGKILSRVNDVWGEEVAVRLENGRIAHLRVTEDTKFSIEKTASARSAAVTLTERLEAPFNTDRAALFVRIQDLDTIRHAANTALPTASHEDAATLDGIVVAAAAEKIALRQALDAIEAQESQAFSYRRLEYTAGPVGESLGGADASWLDNTVNSMIAEAEGTDFDQVLAEEPSTLVASLSDGTVADMGSTRACAMAHIRSRTAGIAADRAEQITRQFLTNVEAVRKADLASRKQTTHKEASAKEDRYADLPDDILFS